MLVCMQMQQSKLLLRYVYLAQRQYWYAECKQGRHVQVTNKDCQSRYQSTRLNTALVQHHNNGCNSVATVNAPQLGLRLNNKFRKPQACLFSRRSSSRWRYGVGGCVVVVVGGLEGSDCCDQNSSQHLRDGEGHSEVDQCRGLRVHRRLSSCMCVKYDQEYVKLFRYGS